MFRNLTLTDIHFGDIYKKIVTFFRNNIQTNQTLFLSCILILGIEYNDIYYNYTKLFVVFLTVIGLDALFIRIKTGKWSFPYSGVNAGFGISFFLRTDELIIYFFAWFLAIVGKHIFTFKWRHFMNPSNMGVFLILILFPFYAWTSSFQWGNYSGIISSKYLLAASIVFLFGFLITYRVNKVFGFRYYFDYLLPFFLLHIVLFFIIPYSESISSALQFFGIPFFIFMFFMISDPKTVPERSESRFLYAISLVLSFYVLQFFINENYALLASLFINTLTLPLIWHWEKENCFGEVKKATIFLLTLVFFLISSLPFLIQSYGQPDLVFDNRCSQLICK